MVKSMKQALNKASNSDSIEIKIAKFHAGYRNAPHSITGRTPAQVLLGQLPRTNCVCVCVVCVHACVCASVCECKCFNKSQILILTDVALVNQLVMTT